MISQPDYPDDPSGRLSSTFGKPKGGNYCLDDSHLAGLSGKPSPGRVVRTTPTWQGRRMNSTRLGCLDDPHPAGSSVQPPPGRVVRTALCWLGSLDTIIQIYVSLLDSDSPPVLRNALSTLNFVHHFHWFFFTQNFYPATINSQQVFQVLYE